MAATTSISSLGQFFEMTQAWLRTSSIHHGGSTDPSTVASRGRTRSSTVGLRAGESRGMGSALRTSASSILRRRSHSPVSPEGPLSTGRRASVAGSPSRVRLSSPKSGRRPAYDDTFGRESNNLTLTESEPTSDFGVAHSSGIGGSGSSSSTSSTSSIGSRKVSGVPSRVGGGGRRVMYKGLPRPKTGRRKKGRPSLDRGAVSVDDGDELVTRSSTDPGWMTDDGRRNSVSASVSHSSGLPPPYVIQLEAEKNVLLEQMVTLQQTIREVGEMLRKQDSKVAELGKQNECLSEEANHLVDENQELRDSLMAAQKEKQKAWEECQVYKVSAIARRDKIITLTNEMQQSTAEKQKLVSYTQKLLEDLGSERSKNRKLSSQIQKYERLHRDLVRKRQESLSALSQFMDATGEMGLGPIIDERSDDDEEWTMDSESERVRGRSANSLAARVARPPADSMDESSGLSPIGFGRRKGSSSISYRKGSSEDIKSGRRASDSLSISISDSIDEVRIKRRDSALEEYKMIEAQLAALEAETQELLSDSAELIERNSGTTRSSLDKSIGSGTYPLNPGESTLEEVKESSSVERNKDTPIPGREVRSESADSKTLSKAERKRKKKERKEEKKRRKREKRRAKKLKERSDSVSSTGSSSSVSSVSSDSQMDLLRKSDAPVSLLFAAFEAEMEAEEERGTGEDTSSLTAPTGLDSRGMGAEDMFDDSPRVPRQFSSDTPRFQPTAMDFDDDLEDEFGE